jgi:cytochrome c2
MRRSGFRSIAPWTIVVALTGCGAERAPSAGRLLLEQYQCGACHRIPGVNAAAGRVAGTLESFGSRSYIAGHVPNTHVNLVRWVMAPQAVVPGTLMPDMGVRRAHADEIAAYLLALR